MATVKTRLRTHGTPTYRVVWRAGGGRDGDWESETFLSKSEAGRFRRDVDLAGQQWPDGWEKGVGYLVPEPEPQPVDQLPVPSLLAFGQQYVRDLTGVTPATRHRYDRQVITLAEQLREVLGCEVTVVNVESVNVRRWVNAREAAGARPKTISNYHGLLFMVLASAARSGLRAGNPCEGTRLPHRYSPDVEGDGEPVFLTEQQFALLADAMFPATGLTEVPGPRAERLDRRGPGKRAGSVEDRWLLQVAVGTGLRWSELTALQVQDLQLEGPVLSLSVRRAWKRNPKGEFSVPGAGAFYLGAPKTKKSLCRVTLSPSVAQLLSDAARGKLARDFVFTASKGGPLNHATFYEDRWKRAVRLAESRGLPVRPRLHDLRHTHAAWLISAGVPLPVVQQRLGHESITTTVDIYGGLLLQAHSAADAAIDAALAGLAVPSPPVPRGEARRPALRAV